MSKFSLTTSVPYLVIIKTYPDQICFTLSHYHNLAWPNLLFTVLKRWWGGWRIICKICSYKINQNEFYNERLHQLTVNNFTFMKPIFFRMLSRSTVHLWIRGGNYSHTYRIDAKHIIDYSPVSTEQSFPTNKVPMNFCLQLQALLNYYIHPMCFDIKVGWLIGWSKQIAVDR